MKNTYYLVLLVSLILLHSCTPEPLPTPPAPTVPPPTFLDNSLVWQVSVTPDSALCSAEYVLFTGNTAIFNNSFCNADASLHAHNAQTGQLLWQRIPSDLFEGGFSGAFPIDDQHAFLYFWGRGAMINVENKTLIWEYNLRENSNINADPRVGRFKNLLFQPINDGKVSPDVAHLLYTSLDYPQWDTLYTFRANEHDGFSPIFIEPASGSINAQGDTIIVFGVRTIKQHDVISKGFVVAFNMTQDTLMWEIPFDIDVLSYEMPIKGNKVYTRSFAKIACLDLLTGATIWEQGNFRGKLGGNLLVVRDRLFSNTSEADGLYAFNANTGAILGRADNKGNVYDILYHKGYIYFTSAGDAKLHCVNSYSMVEEWALDSPNYKYDSNASYAFAGIAIDTVGGYLYTSDGYFAQCFKLRD